MKAMVWRVLGCLALTSVLMFQQLEIATLHEDIQDIKVYLIKTNERIRYTAKEEECLAKNIYHEAGVEPKLGKFAVAQITLNRLRTGAWGSNICSVVYAPKQFSWTLYKKQKYEQPKGELWESSKQVAHVFLAKGYRVSGLESSTLYHADYIKEPLWTKSVVKIQRIGQHVFYAKG